MRREKSEKLCRFFPSQRFEKGKKKRWGKSQAGIFVTFLSSWHLSCCERAQSSLIRLIFYVIFTLLLIIFQFRSCYFSLHVYISFIVHLVVTFLLFSFSAFNSKLNSQLKIWVVFDILRNKWNFMGKNGWNRKKKLMWYFFDRC